MMNTRYRVCFFTIFLLFNGFSYYSIFSQPLSIEELAREKVYNSYDEAFGDPWNCVVLDLSYQNLTFNSERVRNLNNLRVLHLAGNPNVDFEEAFTRKYFGSLPYLQIIDLQENNLKYLPSGLSKFPYLNMFFAGKNQITEIPDYFCRFEYLQVLSLHHNRIRTLPECLGSLDSLQTLDLSGNTSLQLDQVIPILKECRNLRQLYLSECNLDRLPVTISDLQSLHYLNPVSYTHLTLPTIYSV